MRGRSRFKPKSSTANPGVFLPGPPWGYNYKGVVTHRLEVQVRDVVHPFWLVPFVRHFDRWFKSTAANEAVRDEWFARTKAWLNDTRAI